MSDRITTLKLVDNTDVFPNTKEENIPDTIMRIADLSKYINALTSININGDIDSTTTTSDTATFTTADISTLNVSGLSQFEGEATFGSNVHIDGNVIVNGVDNIVDKDGNAIVKNESLDEFRNQFAKYYLADLYCDKGIDMIGETSDILLSREMETIKGTDTEIVMTGCFLNARVYFGPQSDFYTFKVADIPNKVKKSLDAFSGFANNLSKPVTIEFGNFTGDAYYMFGRQAGAKDTIEAFRVAEGKTFVPDDARFMFFGCDSIKSIEGIDFSNCTELKGTFYCGNLKSIKCTHFKVSFDISTSTKFETADLVEIISNLDTVSTAQTLTMGATNLAKLTQEQILVATGKGWTLA